LAYLLHRLRRIQQLRWELDDNIPEDIISSLSEMEKEFLENYDRLLAYHTKHIGIDLTIDQEPPKDLLVEVRVLKNCSYVSSGEIQKLQVNTTHFMKRTQAEPLIRTGFLEHVV